MEFTFLMPCLNEAESLAFCIQEIQASINSLGLDAEILIADNQSTDGSQDIARQLNARVIDVAQKGYGAALIGGIQAARGKYIIMGDSDGSYDFSHLEAFVDALRDGNDLVMGNRFKGGIEKDAMPFSHKIGVPVLSYLARVRFNAPVGDFHCGLRGFDREKALALNLQCTGMEFASEIIVRFAQSDAKIKEVPTILRKDKRSRKPHLRTIRDGFRHLYFIVFNKAL